MAIDPRDGGCLLTLRHERLAALSVAERAATWQQLLAGLAGELGESVPTAAHDELVSAYQTIEASRVAATVRSTGAGWIVELDRVLDAEPAAVWSALTEPDRLGRWLWPVQEWPDDPVRRRPLRAGDTFRLGDENAPARAHEMHVVELDEPRHLVLTWMGATITFAAGWHSLVDGLGALLRGAEVPVNGPLWQAAADFYAHQPS